MLNILVVDDERIAVSGIKKRLQLYQYPLQIYEAYDGEEANRILDNTPIHILMTDIELPFINGLELIEIAKKKHPHIKTIVFSAYSNFEYARKAISLNAIYYLLKPIDVNEFQQVMQRCLDECMKDTGKNEDKPGPQDKSYCDANGVIQYAKAATISYSDHMSGMGLLQVADGDYATTYVSEDNPDMVPMSKGSANLTGCRMVLTGLLIFPST